MELGSNPLVRRTRLGAELQALRDERKLTTKDLAARLGWSTARLSRLENGKIRPDIAMVMDLLDALGVSGLKREALIELAREGSRSGWYAAIGDGAGSQRAYAELEAEAVAINYYNHTAIPGLLQTPDYALTRTQGIGERPADVKETVDARIKRQAKTLGQCDIDAVIDEAALRRTLAPADVTTGQFRHLVTLAGHPRVTLRVMTFDRHTPDYLTCVQPFAIYRYHDPEDPSVVATEMVTALIQLRDIEDVAVYERSYDQIRKAALTPDQSRDFLAALAQS